MLISRVAHTLLRSPPFSRLPLHVRFFAERAHDAFVALEPIEGVSMTIDYGGLTQLDVTDSEYRDDAIEHWPDRESDCALCDDPVEVSQTGDRVDIRTRSSAPTAIAPRICPVSPATFLATLTASSPPVVTVLDAMHRSNGARLLGPSMQCRVSLVDREKVRLGALRHSVSTL